MLPSGEENKLRFCIHFVKEITTLALTVSSRNAFFLLGCFFSKNTSSKILGHRRDGCSQELFHHPPLSERGQSWGWEVPGAGVEQHCQGCEEEQSLHTKFVRDALPFIPKVQKGPLCFLNSFSERSMGLAGSNSSPRLGQ